MLVILSFVYRQGNSWHQAASIAKPGLTGMRARIASRERAIHRIADCLEFIPARALDRFDWCRTRLLLLLEFDAGGGDTGAWVYGKIMGPDQSRA